MLMNGQEVNHLVIGGETFDKSFDGGIKAKTTRDVVPGGINESGIVHSDPGAWYVPKGDTISVIARYKNAVCIATGPGYYAGWITMEAIEFINDTTGGG